MSYAENLTENPSVERLAVEELPQPQSRRPRIEAPSFRILSDEPAVKPAEPESVAARTGQLLEAYKLLGMALSARLLLLLSIFGAFALAVFAMHEQTTPSLLILLAFTVGTVGPTTFLEVWRRN